MAAENIVDTGRAVRIGGRRYPLILPRLSDPRLHVASVLLSVQVLGQVSLGFELSIAQLLVSLGTAAMIEVSLTFSQRRVIAWPASALLTGNGVALILRVPGTEHGDWWSLEGAHIFAACSALSVLSKHVIRVDDRPLFNPSNLGLVVTFLVLGSTGADPQDLWWGPPSWGLALTFVLVTIGGFVVTRRIGLLPVSALFFVVFGALMTLLAATGHCMSARWSLGPVCGRSYWSTMVLSPEILIFLFFMITDPRTVPSGRVGRQLFAVAVAVTCALFVAFQTTEYATKVALLTGLVVVCTGRPFIERRVSADQASPPLRSSRTTRGTVATRRAAAGATLVLAPALVLGASAFAGSPQDLTHASVDRAQRPDVEIRPDQRPAVTISTDSPVLESFEQDAAQKAVMEVIGALLLCDRALAEGDATLLESVAAGRWREQLIEHLESTSSTVAPDRTFETAELTTHRNPGEFQSVPRLAIALEGTLNGTSWRATYEIAASEAGYVITDELPSS